MRNQAARLARVERHVRLQPVDSTIKIDVEAWRIAHAVYRHYAEDTPCELSVSQQIDAILSREIPSEERWPTMQALDPLGIPVQKILLMATNVRNLFDNLYAMMAHDLIETGEELPEPLKEKFKAEHGFKTIEEHVAWDYRFACEGIDRIERSMATGMPVQAKEVHYAYTLVSAWCENASA